MASQEKNSPALNEPPRAPKTIYDNYTSIAEITTDPYGRRSMAWRHNTTNEIVSSTWLTEQVETSTTMRNFHRRWDQSYVVGELIFQRIDSWVMKQVLGLLLLVPSFLWLGYMMVMARWDMWMESPTSSEEEAEQEES